MLYQMHEFGRTIGELRNIAKETIVKLNLSNDVVKDFERGILHCTECNIALFQNYPINECIAHNSNERYVTKGEMEILEEVGFMSFDEQIERSEYTFSTTGCHGIPYYIIKSNLDNLLYVLCIISYGRSKVYDSIEDDSLRLFYPMIVDPNNKRRNQILISKTMILYPANGKLVYIA